MPWEDLVVGLELFERDEALGAFAGVKGLRWVDLDADEVGTLLDA